MIDADTAVNGTIAHRALIGTTVGAILGVLYMAFEGTNIIYMIGVLAGTLLALVPIALAVKKSPPAKMSDISRLSRTSTKSFVMWLIMMGIYLVMLMPMGPEIFQIGVSTCVVGLLASRLVFPIYTAVMIEAFGLPHSSHDP